MLSIQVPIRTHLLAGIPAASIPAFELHATQVAVELSHSPKVAEHFHLVGAFELLTHHFHRAIPVAGGLLQIRMLRAGLGQFL